MGEIVGDAGSDRGSAGTEEARLTSHSGARTFEDAREAAHAEARDDAIPVSVIVMTKDEERDLPECLASLHRFGEVFVVDSGSSDRTSEIARDNGVFLINFEWNQRYPKKKQWCLENLPFSHTWVLYVDADERMTPELAAEIEGHIRGRVQDQEANYLGFYVGLDYVFLGRVLRHGQRIYKLVLHDRTRSHFPDYDDLDADNMWEVEGHYQPVVEGRVGTLRARLIHDDHDSLYEYFARHNRYSDWEAVLSKKDAHVGRAQAQAGTRTHAANIFAKLPFKPLIFFLYSYVLRGGFFDGTAGFHYAIAKSFYYWQIGLKKKERELVARDAPD